MRLMVRGRATGNPCNRVPIAKLASSVPLETGFSSPIGTACVYALGAMPGSEGLAQLALLKVKVKFGTAQKGIEKALTAVAERLGLPRDEIEELAVPTYGLEEVGLRREP